MCNLSLCATFPTRGTLESLMRKMPNYAFDIFHMELQSPGCKIINVRPQQTWHQVCHQQPDPARIHCSLSSWEIPTHFIFKCRDSGINGNLLPLMKRLQIAINHVRFCPSGGTRIAPFS